MNALERMFTVTPVMVQKEKQKELEEKENALEFKKMKKQIQDLQKVIALSPKPREKKNSFNITQQVSALKYLGGLDNIIEIDNATAVANFLSKVLNKNEQNIRIELTPIKISELTYSTSPSKRKAIKKQLIPVYEAFIELGAKTLAEKVSDDIKRLDQ